MSKYTQGVCEDGAAILKDGERITVDDVVAALNEPTARELLASLGERILRDNHHQIEIGLVRTLSGEGSFTLFALLPDGAGKKTPFECYTRATLSSKDELGDELMIELGLSANPT